MTGFGQGVWVKVAGEGVLGQWHDPRETGRAGVTMACGRTIAVGVELEALDSRLIPDAQRCPACQGAQRPDQQPIGRAPA